MIDVEKLRELLQAERHADLVARANPGNGEALARACNLTGSLTEAAVNALPELLAVYEAACALVDTRWLPEWLQVDVLRDAVDAARKVGT